MLFVWGKRSYGAVEKVGNVSIKTVFGHLWYIPLFPMTSYYVQHKTDAAFELNNINWRSVLCAYLRIWLAVALLVMLVPAKQAAEDGNFSILAILIVAMLTIAGSYLVDKKLARYPDRVLVRKLMERHFGVALDPYECLNNFQQNITEKMASIRHQPLDEYWYKTVLADEFSDNHSVELAILRARCDQQDHELQALALRKLMCTADKNKLPV